MTHVYTSADKDRAICKKELDMIPNGNFRSTGYEECHNMQFFHIYGITKFWDDEDKFDVHNLGSDILSGCVRHGMPFSYVIIGDKHGINLYVGTVKLLLPKLMDSYESLYLGITTKVADTSPLRSGTWSYGGLFSGIPTNKSTAEQRNFQIENICRGMLGKNFIYVVLASGLSNIAVTLGHEKILDEMETTFSYISQSFSGGAQGNVSAQRQDFQQCQ